MIYPLALRDIPFIAPDYPFIGRPLSTSPAILRALPGQFAQSAVKKNRNHYRIKLAFKICCLVVIHTFPHNSTPSHQFSTTKFFITWYS